MQLNTNSPSSDTLGLTDNWSEPTARLKTLHTAKIYHYDSMEQLNKHLQEFLLAYNFAKKLKTLKFKTPFEFLTEKFLTEKFKDNPKVFYQNSVRCLKGFNT